MKEGDRARILLLEDDNPSRDLVVMGLEPQGHRIIFQAKTVEQALNLIPDALREENINTALLDERLPDGSGQQVAQAIRGSSLPITIFAYSVSRNVPRWGDHNFPKDRIMELFDMVDDLNPHP